MLQIYDKIYAQIFTNFNFLLPDFIQLLYKKARGVTTHQIICKYVFLFDMVELSKGGKKNYCIGNHFIALIPWVKNIKLIPVSAKVNWLKICYDFNIIFLKIISKFSSHLKLD